MWRAHGGHVGTRLLCAAKCCTFQSTRKLETPWIGSPQGEFPMSHVTSVSPLHFALTEAPVEDQPGFFKRLLVAMMASRQAQAEREIATFLRASGGKFTDESEREIERLLLAPKSHW